jgi:hypothetical protein
MFEILEKVLKRKTDLDDTTLKNIVSYFKIIHTK